MTLLPVVMHRLELNPIPERDSAGKEIYYDKSLRRTMAE
jgi:hypothetical protein